MKFLAVAALAGATLVASAADAQMMYAGGKVGANFNQLSQPSDPAGEPTVLFGTAFTGFGFQAGGAFYRELTRLGPGPLLLDAELLVAHQRASGFAESRTSDARSTISISTTSLRLPVLLALGFSGDGSLFNIGIGPELLLGLSAGSKAKAEGGAAPGDPLPVRAVTHVGLTAHLGMVFDGGAQKYPVDLRFTWDPMVAKSTRERFDAFVDYDNPGKYAVAFNWQASLMVGWLFDLGAPKTERTPLGEPEPATPPPRPAADNPPDDEEPDF